MAGFQDALAGMLDKIQNKPARSKKSGKEHETLHLPILALSKKSDVPTLVKIAEFCPLTLVYIKGYASKSKLRLRSALNYLRLRGEKVGVKAALLDESWMLLMPSSTQLVKKL